MSAAEEINPLELSDDEIDAAIMRELSRSTDDSDTVEEDQTEEVVEDTADTIEEPEEESEDGLQEEEGQQETEDEVDSSSELDQEESEEDTTDSETTDDSIDNTKESSNIDYEAEYKALFAPLKANGSEMQVKNVADARKLMAMGANYHQKMAALKPNLKVLKLLEKNDLLNPDRISYMIDLSKKDPEAIKQLIKDSNIDPLDLDISEKGNYKPTPYNVSDAEIELDNVLSEIKDTSTFNETMNIIGNKWDEASQEAAVKEPELIRVINEQVASGLYHRIMDQVNYERGLGRLKGLSDVQAYYQIGQQITAADTKSQTGHSSSTSQPNSVNKAATKTVDPKLASRKKAASSTKSAPRAKQAQDFNPLAMSDEEFAKLVAEKFI